MEETNNKGELLKRIKAEATGLDVLKRIERNGADLDGKTNDGDLCKNSYGCSQKYFS
jgi:hypothetical protein